MKNLLITGGAGKADVCYMVQPEPLGLCDSILRALPLIRPDEYSIFDFTVTFCFTPEAKGIRPHHASPPGSVWEYADFCAAMVRRYAR